MYNLMYRYIIQYMTTVATTGYQCYLECMCDLFHLIDYSYQFTIYLMINLSINWLGVTVYNTCHMYVPSIVVYPLLL